MNVLLDLAVALILGLSVFFAAKNGFFKTLLSGTAFLLAVIITLAFVTPVRAALLETDFYSGMKEDMQLSIEEHIRSAMESDPESDNKPLSETLLENEVISKVIEAVGIDLDEAKKDLDISGSIDSAIKKFSATLAEKLSEFAIGAISAIALFLVSLILLKLLSLLLSAICKLPVLKQANELCGGLLGLVLGVIRVLVLVSIVKLLIPVMQTSEIAFFAQIDPAKTLLFGFFCNFNLLSFLS